MSLSSLFKKVGDYHLAHRGRIGLVFGLAAGIGLSYTGVGQELARDWANLFADASTSAETRRVLAGQGLEIMAIGTTLVSLLADAGLHAYRSRAAANPSPRP